MASTRCLVLALAAISGLAGDALAQPPAAPTPTLWNFLAVPQGYRYFRDNTFNRRGLRPLTERQPPLKAIADDRNLKSGNPEIQEAAEIKQAEDSAPQKIKAVRYLAQIGCGCYNRDGGITDALLKSIDDCTEDVRYATITAISEAAAGEACVNCRQRSCCSQAISDKLFELAYGRDDLGCYLEPSERIRLVAAEALRVCCSGSREMLPEPALLPTLANPPPPVEAPRAAPPAGVEGAPIVPPGPAPVIPLSLLGPEPLTGQALTNQALPATFVASPAASLAATPTAAMLNRLPVVPRLLPGQEFGSGTVVAVRRRDGVVALKFESPLPVPPGSILRAYHEFALSGKTSVCDLEIIQSEAGVTTAVPRPGHHLRKLEVGDSAVVLQ